jgi:hypothetical protein
MIRGMAPHVHHRRRATAAAACLLAATLIGGGGASAQSSKTAVQTDPAGDVADGGLDLRRVSLGRGSDGRIRASLTMAEEWEASDLEARTGPPGSVCLRLWTASEAPDNPPDYLVCVTAAGDDELRASVLRERPNQLPQRVGNAAISRSSSRSVTLRFSQSVVGRPALLTFSGEASKAGCARVSCIDTAPDGRKVRRFRLRKPASTGD